MANPIKSGTQIVHQLKQNANNYVKNINYDKNTMISTKFDVKNMLSLHLNGTIYWHDNLTNMKKKLTNSF